MKIPLEGKSRLKILYAINQWIIFQDYLSNSFYVVKFYQNKKIRKNYFFLIKIKQIGF
jgi:hypothetical protein